MALIKCKNCGKQISDKSKQCIHCGKELSNNSTDDLESKSLKQQVETTKTKEDTKKQVKNISNKMLDIFRYFIGTIFLISILGLKGFQIITMLCMVLLIYPFSANYLYSKINIPKALRIIIPCALLMFTFMIDEDFDKYMEESKNKSNQNQQETQQNDNNKETTNNNEDTKKNDNKENQNKDKENETETKQQKSDCDIKKFEEYLLSIKFTDNKDNTYTYLYSLDGKTDYYKIDLGNQIYTRTTSDKTNYFEFNYGKDTATYTNTIDNYYIEINCSSVSNKQCQCKTNIPSGCEDNTSRVKLLTDHINTLTRYVNESKSYCKYDELKK